LFILFPFLDDDHLLAAEAASYLCQQTFEREPVMSRSLFATPALLLLAPWVGCDTAQAGPCTAQIVQVEQQIRKAQAAGDPGGAGAPTAPQSVGAQLHHQPTPGAVAGAEGKARDAAMAALERARNADAANDAAGCARALTDAKELYGLQ
jgi:hypothetical protein